LLCGLSGKGELPKGNFEGELKGNFGNFGDGEIWYEVSKFRVT
jgi:hypothetical protein